MNRFFTLLLAASCLTAVGQVPDYVPTDGLVAWYPFNGDAHDDSGNGNDGVSVSVESAFDRFGNENSAFYFSGSGCTPRVDIDMNTTEIVDAITISIWFNRQGNGCASPRLFEAKPPNGDQGLGHMIIAWGNGYAHPGQWNHNLNASSSTAYDVFLPADSVADIANDSWGMLVYRNDGLAASYFQNGVRIATMSNPENSTIHLPSDIAIGRMNHPAFDAFNGLIDDVGFWSRALSDQEILALYNAEVSVPGCTESEACNYAPEANVDDGSCELFTCKCLEGTVWSEELGGCIVANPSDSNFDGCVQLNDLLDLLSAYGNCGAEETLWQCGDPLEYQGYDYETVQIGEQCWFAENCRFLPEVYSSENGSDTIPRAYVLNYDGEDLGEAELAEEYLLGGALYNYPATSFWDLCPADWHVGNDIDWALLEGFASLPDSLADQSGWRGAHAADLKSTEWDGNDSFGFSIRAHGYRDIYSEATYWGEVGNSAAFWAGQHNRFFQTDFQGVLREIEDPSYGFSVRCIKDAE